MSQELDRVPETLSGTADLLEGDQLVVTVQCSVYVIREYQYLSAFHRTDRVEGIPTFVRGQITSGYAPDGRYTLRLHAGLELSCEIRGGQLIPA